MNPHLFLPDVFFFNDTATTEIYTLSLHDALPISDHRQVRIGAEQLVRPRRGVGVREQVGGLDDAVHGDRKSTRLNSSHSQISYAVFCLKKKKTPTNSTHVLRETVHREPLSSVIVT